MLLGLFNTLPSRHLDAFHVIAVIAEQGRTRHRYRKVPDERVVDEPVQLYEEFFYLQGQGPYPVAAVYCKEFPFLAVAP